MNDLVVISVGGSLIIPSHGVDTLFLQRLNNFIREHAALGRRFMLVAGGGYLARQYRDAGRAVVSTMTDHDLDWLGIHATRMNGHLLRTIFEDIAHSRMIENYDHLLENWTEPVVIGAGWKPGQSSDYEAVLLARDYGGDLIINLSDIPYLYDKDPKKYPDAKALHDVTWDTLQSLVGTTWSPGMNTPFDPIATELGRSLGLNLYIIKGGDFDNANAVIEGREFVGTKVHA